MRARGGLRPSLISILALGLASPGLAGAAGDGDDTGTADNNKRVVLIVASAPRLRLDEIETRVRGEAQAAGFELAETLSQPAGTWRARVCEEARTRGLATIGIAIDDDLVDVEICLFEGNVRRTTAQIIPLASVPAPRRTAVVAVVAVDLLKTAVASPAPRRAAANPPAAPAALEAAPPATAPPPPPEPAATIARAAPTPPLPRRPTLALGGGWLEAGRASGWAPLLSATVLGSRLGARATVSGLGTTAEVSAEAGSARLTHLLALGELVIALPLARHIDLVGGVGAGAWRLAVDGHGAPGYAGSTTAAWSAVGVVAVGAGWTITPRLALALDARVLAAGTSTVVRLDGDDVARVGRPLVWLTAGLGVRL